MIVGFFFTTTCGRCSRGVDVGEEDEIFSSAPVEVRKVELFMIQAGVSAVSS
jgi:hypothetical protein